jgi:hypothetical protein
LLLKVETILRGDSVRAALILDQLFIFAAALLDSYWRVEHVRLIVESASRIGLLDRAVGYIDIL